MLCKLIHCAGHITADTRPHQLCWDDERVSSVHIIMPSCEQFHSSSSSPICVSDFTQYVAQALIITTFTMLQSILPLLEINTSLMSQDCHSSVVEH